jgi:hypothetical protein
MVGDWRHLSSFAGHRLLLWWKRRHGALVHGTTRLNSLQINTPSRGTFLDRPCSGGLFHARLRILQDKEGGHPAI